MKLAAHDLLLGAMYLMKVSTEVKVPGMARKWVSPDFDTKMTLRVSTSEGSVYRVRGKGWSFTVRFNSPTPEIVSLMGSHEDINQTLLLAQLAA